MPPKRAVMGIEILGTLNKNAKNIATILGIKKSESILY